LDRKTADHPQDAQINLDQQSGHASTPAPPQCSTVRDRFRLRRLQLFEDLVVATIFIESGLRSQLDLLRNRSLLDVGDRHLRLKLLHRWFPRFPIMLATPRADPVIDFRLPALWSTFPRNPLYSEYRSQPFADAAFLGQSYFGLVFHAGPIGLMVMHNDLPRDRSTEMETVIEKVYGRRRIRFVIEPFAPLVRGIAPTWYHPECLER
jgi:hypothetical protein